MDFKCIKCGNVNDTGSLQKDMLKQAAKKSIPIFGLFAPAVTIRCLKCEVKGPSNFVCADCGKPHMWKPGKCNNV